MSGRILLTVCLATASFLAGSASTAAAKPKPKPTTMVCKSAAKSDPGQGATGGGYRYRLEVKVPDASLKPFSGGCSTTGGGDQLGLISSAPTADGWECLYGSPNDSAGAIRITASVVGCKEVPIK